MEPTEQPLEEPVENIFTQLAEESDDDFVEEVSEPADEAPPEELEAEAPPSDEPEPEVPEPAPTIEPPEEPPVVEAAETPAEPTPEVRAPASFEEIVKRREEAEAKLAEHFRLPEADRELWMTDPEKATSKLLAKHYIDTVVAVSQQVQSHLPALLKHTSEAQRKNAEYEEKFFTQWPTLKDPKYRSVVETAAIAIRRDNPKATPDEIIRDAGLFASIKLRLPIPGMQQPQQAKPTPPAPRAPVVGAVRSPVKSDNIFSQLAEEEID